MEQKRRALGKGLEQLFNNESINFDQIEEKIVLETSKDEIVNIPLSDLRSNPYQPRLYFDEESLNELSDSIKEHGVFQPIIVKKSIKGYEIVAGERRVRASTRAGLSEIPAIIRDFDDADMMQIALLENLQRENLSAIEEAKGYSDLIEKLNITQEELAHRMGKSRSHITNMLGLLRLPPEVKTMINTKQISMGHARVLSKLEDKNLMIELAKKIIAENLSVRDIEELTSNNNKFVKASPINKAKTPKNRPYVYVEDYLKEKLGSKVKVTEKKLEISFSSAKDLDRILEILNVKIN